MGAQSNQGSTKVATSDYGTFTPGDVRRIKQKNYGKWYLLPKQFNKKLAPLANKN